MLHQLKKELDRYRVTISFAKRNWNGVWVDADQLWLLRLINQEKRISHSKFKFVAMNIKQLLYWNMCATKVLDFKRECDQIC